MLNKLLILALLLITIGAFTFGWVYIDRKSQAELAKTYQKKYAGESDQYLEEYKAWINSPADSNLDASWELPEPKQLKSPLQIEQQQQERLIADMDKLAASKTVYPFADTLYGNGWQQEVEKYKAKKAKQEMVFNASIVAFAMGGGVFSICVMTYLFKGFHAFKSLLSKTFGYTSKNMKKKIEIQVPVEQNTPSEPIEKISESKEDETDEAELVVTHSGFHKLNQTVTNEQSQSDTSSEQELLWWQKMEDVQEKQPETEPSMPSVMGSTSAAFIIDSDHNENNQNNEQPQQEKIRLDSEEKSKEPQIKNKTSQPEPKQSDNNFESKLKLQAEQIEQHLTEFKEISKTVKQAAEENSEPITTTLNQLTEQVSAIREYASKQQERISKLQNGYDWNIIRTFCLKIIRCIDNLENKIAKIKNENHETDISGFEEIRDELLFALESSGIEQFKPEINSDYHGQEKIAEAVKDRAHSDQPQMKGKIARVIRPGYKYIIDEENSKVVRCAQVKLFG